MTTVSMVKDFDVLKNGPLRFWNSPAFTETRNIRANPSLVQKQPG
jgi:hypothetical protein